MFEFIKRLFHRQPEFFPGVLGEGSPTGNVHEFSEVVGESTAPVFKEKKRSEWRTFFRQFQNSSSACVAYTLAKIATILYYLKTGRIVKFSPAFWYKRRPNSPQLGMVFSDIEKLGTDGAVIHELLPCEGMTEDQINAVVIEQYHRDTADAFALPGHWVNLPLDFDIVAATIQKTGKGMMLWFRIHYGEWFGVEKPLVSKRLWFSNHSTTAVDAFKFGGVDFILLEDSAEDKVWQKLITREFFKARCYLARYPVNFKFVPGSERPVYDGSITSLQECLKYEGIFPSNVKVINIFGPLTKQSVVQFQTKYALPQDGALNPLTVKKLKELYS